MSTIIQFSEKFSAILLSLIVFLLPINHTYISPCIVLWIFSSVTSIFFNKSKFQLNNALIGLIIFYVSVVIGLLWTDNMPGGLFDLEVKMSLVIFPLILLFKQYSLKQLRWVVLAFISGLILSSFYLLYEAILKFSESGDYNSFSYVDLSFIIHPTYLSLYYAIAMIILLVDLIKKQFVKKQWISIVLISYFFSYNLLLMSKAGIIAISLFLMIFIIVWSIKKRKLVFPLLIIIMLVGSLYVSYQKSPLLKHRVDELVYGLFPDPEKKNNGSTGIRLQIWTQGLFLIKEKPLLGHGTGDVKDVLMDRYEKSGMTSALDKKLNAHNQFIQILIALGVVGLLLFVFVLIESVIKGLWGNNLFIVSFILMFVAYALTESILENQAGTIFFGLFFSILNQKVFFTDEESKC